MYKVWFDDLEKAVKAFRKVVKDDLFYSIEGNAMGNFIFRIDEGNTYIVNHKDFTVWRNFGTCFDAEWKEIAPVSNI